MLSFVAAAAAGKGVDAAVPMAREYCRRDDSSSGWKTIRATSEPASLRSVSLCLLVLRARSLAIVEGQGVPALIVNRADARDDNFVTLSEDLLEEALLGESVCQLEHLRVESRGRRRALALSA